MAKLTDRQRDNIQAKWDTGNYTKVDLAKSYKVTEKVIRNIVGKAEPKNAHIVEAGAMLESLKKEGKSPLEVRQIDHAIKERVKIVYDKEVLKENIFETQLKAVKKINDLLDAGSYQKPIKMKNGDHDVVEQHEHDLTTGDIKNCIEAVDKAGQTLEIVDRGGKSVEVNTQNNVQSKTDIVGYKVNTIE